MKKQNTLEFLVKHLDHWPTRLGGAPVIDGYKWAIYSFDLILLSRQLSAGDMIVTDLMITKKEWLLAQLKDNSDKFEAGYNPVLAPVTKQKIYIAGPMTGYENFNRKAFNDAALKLSLNYTVLNPAILPDGLSQKDHMSICLPMVACCDAIYLLDGWEDSKGANAECSLAEKLGLEIILESK